MWTIHFWNILLKQVLKLGKGDVWFKLWFQFMTYSSRMFLGLYFPLFCFLFILFLICFAFCNLLCFFGFHHNSIEISSGFCYPIYKLWFAYRRGLQWLLTLTGRQRCPCSQHVARVFEWFHVGNMLRSEFGYMDFQWGFMGFKCPEIGTFVFFAGLVHEGYDLKSALASCLTFLLGLVLSSFLWCDVMWKQGSLFFNLLPFSLARWLRSACQLVFEDYDLPSISRGIVSSLSE